MDENRPQKIVARGKKRRRLSSEEDIFDFDDDNEFEDAPAAAESRNDAPSEDELVCVYQSNAQDVETLAASDETLGERLAFFACL